MTANAQRNERCGTCRYWVADSSACHRRAPGLALTVSSEPPADAPPARPTAVWPVTAETEWCGEWAPAADLPEAEKEAAEENVAVRLFLARVAPGLEGRNPSALLDSLLAQLPSDVRQVLVRSHGLDGRPPVGLKEVAREYKMSQGHVRALLETGERLLAEVVRLLSQRERR